MRKNKFFMLGIITVFVAILSLTFVSSTFARYTSTVTGSDSAKVAKWSFNYKGQDQGNEEIDDFSTDTITFNLFNTIKDSSGEGDDSDVKDTNDEGQTLIAPGTRGSFQFSLRNDSDVTAEYHIVFAETNASEIPLQYSIDGENWYDSMVQLNNANPEETRVEGKLPVFNLAAPKLHATLNMDDPNGAKLTVYWRWIFDADEFNGEHADQTDQSDTELGGANELATVTITATITFYQVD